MRSVLINELNRKCRILSLLILLILFRCQAVSLAKEGEIQKKFLKAYSSTVKNSSVRFVIVPDFDQIGGCQGFIRILPQIKALHPSTIVLSAEDVMRNEANKDFLCAIRSVNSKQLSPYAVIFDRLVSKDKSSAKFDKQDGIVRYGMIRLPSAKEDTNRCNDKSCSNIILPWLSKPGALSMLGAVLLASGYGQMQKQGVALIKAMPSDFQRKELLVIDVYKERVRLQGSAPATYPKGFGYEAHVLPMNKLENRLRVGDFDHTLRHSK